MEDCVSLKLAVMNVICILIKANLMKSRKELEYLVVLKDFSLMRKH